MANDTTLDEAIRLGHEARQAQRHDESLEHYQAAGRIAPHLPAITLECAHQLGLLGRHDEAEALYRELMTSMPDTPRIHRGLGLASASRGALQAAVEHYHAAVRLSPDVGWIDMEFLDLLRASGQSEAATQLCGELERKSPASPLPWIERARQARDRGSLEDARSALHAALARDPKSIWALAALASEERHHGSTTTALDLCARLRALDPANATAYLIEAAIHREAERYEEAERVLDQGLGHTGQAFDLVLERARLKRVQGQLEAARSILAATVDTQFTNPTIEQILATLDETRGDILAARRLQPSLGHQSNSHVAALVELAELESQSKNHARAYDLAIAALALKPDDLPASLLRSQLLINAGRFDEALALLAAGRKTFGNQPLYFARLGHFYQQAGLFPWALEVLEEGRKRFPADFNVLSQWVSCAMRRGYLAAVRRALGSYRPAGPDQLRLHAIMTSHLRKAEGRFEEAYAIQDELAKDPTAPAYAGAEAARSAIPLLDPQAARSHLQSYAAKAERDPASPYRKIIISHSLVGQIAAEFLLDPEACAAARTARAMPQPERIAALLQVAGEFPENTTAAIALCVELRRLGLFKSPLPLEEDDTGSIPRSIFQFWDREELPEDVAAYCSSWQEMNPDFSYRLFNRKTAADYLREHASAETQSAFRRVRAAAGKADILRLAVLCHEGGIYCDADDRCLSPLDGLLASKATLIAHQEDIGSIGNNFLAAAPHHPVIEHALREASASIAAGANDSIWLSTGPGQVSRSFAATLAAEGDRWPQALERTKIFWWTELAAWCAPHCFAAYKNTSAHWSSTAARAARNPEPRLTAARR